MDAGLGRTFGHYEYLVGFQGFYRRKCSVGFSESLIAFRACRHPTIMLILVQGLHKFVWCLSDLLCRLPRSFSIGCIMDREHSGLLGVLHWFIHRPSYRCRLLSSGLL